MRMQKLFFLGVRNLWRKKGRSILLGISLFLLSFFAVIFVGYAGGIKKQMIDDALENFVGNLIIYHRGSQEDILWPEKLVSFEGEEIIQKIRSLGVKVRRQYRSQAFVYYREKQTAVLLLGCEGDIFSSLYLKEGKEDVLRDENVIFFTASKMEDLDVKVGDRVAVQVITEDGWPNVDYFRVGGIFQIKGISDLLAGHFAIIPLEVMRKLKNASPVAITEIVCRGKSEERNEILSFFRNTHEIISLDYVKGEDYGSLLFSIAKVNVISVFVILGITILVVMVFLFDTMLAVVEERKKEIGIMMSMGIEGMELGFIFIAEVLSLSLLFVLPGVVAGGGVVFLFSNVGFSLPGEIMAVVMGGYSKLFPVVKVGGLVWLYLLFTVIMLGTSAYAIWKAIKLSPVEVLRNE